VFKFPAEHSTAEFNPFKIYVNLMMHNTSVFTSQRTESVTIRMTS